MTKRAETLSSHDVFFELRQQVTNKTFFILREAITRLEPLELSAIVSVMQELHNQINDQLDTRGSLSFVYVRIDRILPVEKFIIERLADSSKLVGYIKPENLGPQIEAIRYEPTQIEGLWIESVSFGSHPEEPKHAIVGNVRASRAVYNQENE